MTATPVIEQLDVRVFGRPAPQGSKRRGAHGQLIEANPHLKAWRAAVLTAVLERFYRLGIRRGDLPLFRGPVCFGGHFYMPPGRRIDASPDLDKLCRAVWDALTDAKAWEDDGRVVEIGWAAKLPSGAVEKPGVRFSVWQANEG